MVTTYSYCGLNITSNILIPELPGSPNDGAGLSFYLARPREQSTTQRWLHHWRSAQGEILLSYRRQDSLHWLQFPRLADFTISANANKISCYPVPEVPQETIRHLLLDQALPRFLAHHGRIMLHGSAACLDGGLILFLGDSGSGKSTLAGNFHQAGHWALSDDCVWLKEMDRQVVAVPSYGGLRLWEDSLNVLFASGQATRSMAHYSDKRRVSLYRDAGPKSGASLPVLAVMVLTPPDQESAPEVRLTRLSRRETFIAMLKQTFQLDLTDLHRMTRHAENLARIVPRVPTYSLSMPHNFDLLPLARQKILEAVL